MNERQTLIGSITSQVCCVERNFSCGNCKSFSTVSGVSENLKTTIPNKTKQNKNFLPCSCFFQVNGIDLNNNLPFFSGHNSHTLIELCFYVLRHRYHTLNLCYIIYSPKIFPIGITISPKSHFLYCESI